MAKKPAKSRTLTNVSAPSVSAAYAIADTIIKPDQFFTNAGRNTPEREKIIAKLEAFAARLDFRFEHTVIGKQDAVKMVGEALGPHMPLRRTLWTMTFRDLYARDRFYLWLQHRVDRWNDWGELAHHKGGRALSEHLLHLKFADEPIDLAG